MTQQTAEKIEVVLTCDRETPGTFRFTATARVPVRSVYVSKASLPTAIVGRTRVRVTVERVDA